MARKTLNQHNKDRMEALEQDFPTQACGIDCDSCGKELKDLYHGVSTGFPPETPVFCVWCGFKGYRLV